MVCNYKLRSVWLSLPLRRMDYASPYNSFNTATMTMGYICGFAAGFLGVWGHIPQL